MLLDFRTGTVSGWRRLDPSTARGIAGLYRSATGASSGEVKGDSEDGG